MSWPLSHEFNEAIQNPKVAFADPELRDGEPVVGATGLPLPRSGNFADVYQVRGAGGRDWAVKCFTRPVTGLAERYARVSEALERANLPFNVGFKFLAEGIRVGGAWRPVVMMEWVEGLLLNQVAREAAGKPQTLGALGQMWAKLCRRLRKAGIAHADLQHGNVLMVPGNRAGAYGLKLIDYDGVWVPALANVPSGESGHPSFQHPARAATRTYSPDVDRFPHLVVAAALRGLAAGGAALWERYDNGDNLLFTEDDYKKPVESKLMRELWELHDPAVQALVGRLAIACGQPIPQTPWLDRIAPEGEPVPLDEPTRLEAAAALGIALPVPVALPPEPGAEPFELVPLPVPEEHPFTVVDEADEYDDEGDEYDDEDDADKDDGPPRPKRSAPERPRTRETKTYPKAKAGGGKVLVFAAIGAAAVVLVGALAAAVMLGGGRSKPEAQTPPKDAPPTAAEQGALKAPHARPQTDPEPEIPFTVPQSVPYPPAGGRYGLRLVWTTAEDLGGGLYPVCTLSSKLIAFPGVMGGDSRGAVLDAATGKRVAQSQARPAAGSFDRLQPLNDERFAVTAQHSLAPIPVVDARTGQTTELPYIPGPRRVTFEQVSPGAQYVALCVPPLAPDVGSFKLMRTSDERVLLDLTCPAVRAHFAADGTRVLLVERTGTCRWFKLPSGRPDGQFDLPIATDKWQGGGLSAVSADGSVLVFSGSLSGHTGDGHILDGRTGRVRASITQPHVTTHPSLSADGALLVVTSSSQGKTTVSVLRTDTAAVVAELEARPGTTYCPTILPDGRGFIVRAHVPGERRSYAQRYDFAPAGASAAPPEATAGRERLKVDLNFQPQFARFSGDGQALTAHADKSKWFALIDARAGKVRTIPTTGDLRAYSLVPLPRGRVGVFDEGTNVVRVLSAETGAQTDTINLPQFPAGYASSFRTIRPSPGGRFVAVGCLGGVRFNPETKRTDEIPGPVQVFDTRTGKTVVSTEWYGDVMHTGFAFSPDSSRVLVIDRRLRGRWYKLPSGEPDSEWVYGGGAGAPAGAAVSVARLSQDGRAVLCNGFAAGRPGAFTLDAATGALGTVFEGAYEIGELSADGTRARLAANKPGRHTSVVVNTSTGSEVGRVEIATGPDSAPNVELAPDGRALLHFDGSKRGPLVVYDLAGAADDPPAPAVGTGPKPRWTGTTQVTGQAVRLHVDTESNLVLVAGSVGGLNAFKLGTGAAAKIDTGRAVGEFYEMTGGRVGIRPRTATGEVLVLEAATGREIKKVPVPAPPPEGGSPRPIPALSPTGTHVALTHANPNAPGPVRVIDLATGKPVVELDWTGGTAHFTADGRRVLLAERTGRCRWYKLPSGAADSEWAGPPDADSTRYQVTSISADGALVGFTVRSGSSGPNRGPMVLDGRTGKPVHRFGADYWLTSQVQLSADGRRAAVARRRDSVDVIDLRTGAVLVRAPIQVQTGAAPFALSRDGAVLVTVPEARAVHVFEVDASKPPAPAANENNSLGKAASPARRERP